MRSSYEMAHNHRSIVVSHQPLPADSDEEESDGGGEGNQKIVDIRIEDGFIALKFSPSAVGRQPELLVPEPVRKITPHRGRHVASTATRTSDQPDTTNMTHDTHRWKYPSVSRTTYLVIPSVATQRAIQVALTCHQQVHACAVTSFSAHTSRKTL